MLSARADDLANVAAAARRSLACDTVVITRRSGDHSRVAAAEGVRMSELRQAWHWFGQMERRLDGSIATTALGAAPTREAASLANLGYVTVISAPLDMGGSRLGAMHVLSRDSRPLDGPLVQAFAAHCAIALAHGRLHRRAASLKEEVRKTRALDDLALTVTDFHALIARLGEAMSGTFGNVACGVMIWDKDRAILRMVPGSFGADETITASYEVPASDHHSNAARVFELQRPYLSNRARGDPAILQDYVHAFGIERLLSVPLRAGDRATGVFHVANKTSDFTVADIEECEQLAPRVALAVEMTRMLTRARRQQKLEGVLAQVAVAVAEGKATQRALSEGLDGLRDVTEASVVALLPTGSDPVVAALPSVSPVRVAALLDEAGRLHGERAHHVQPSGAGDPGTAVFHVPVRIGQQQVGTLSSLRRRGEPFDADERLGMTRLANVVALAWAADEFRRQRTVLARLEERHRIADDLHDQVSQILFAAQMQLDAALEHDGLDRAIGDSMSRARALLVRGDTAIRNVISELSRPTSSSVGSRLAELVAAIEDEFDLPVRCEITNEAREVANQARRPIVETLLKVTRESLINVAKHAGPCRVTVRLDITRSRRLRVSVVDEGTGLARQHDTRSHGLSSLRRAVRKHGGTMRVSSRDAGGTSVQASFAL